VGQCADALTSRACGRSYPEQALTVIEAMAARWGSAPALLGFGLLNEPLVRMWEKGISDSAKI
jgi:aryl-phospho-beta-D-glucosidase BglC (GH1 family)